MTAAAVHAGGCLCGAVRFEARGEAKWTAYCHCHSCRKHTGAPVSAFAGFERERVAFTKGSLATFASSKGVRRGFCAACGSTLTYEGERWPSEIHFHVGAFDMPQDFPPQGLAFPEERLSWFHLSET
ncbi:MAG: GFA family protein [Alphaproteobacteria bacterium]|nr:GFA family protein [Alphaproteobacteria bacterium]